MRSPLTRLVLPRRGQHRTPQKTATQLSLWLELKEAGRCGFSGGILSCLKGRGEGGSFPWRPQIVILRATVPGLSLSQTGDPDLTPSAPWSSLVSSGRAPTRLRGRLTWGHRCAAAGHKETGQGRSRRPKGTRRSAPLWWGTLTERLESLFRELRLNMAGRLLHAAWSVCPCAPRLGGRVAWAGTLGGRWPGCLRLAAPGSLRSARLPLLPSLCLSLSRRQVPPSLPTYPRPPQLRPTVHWPFPSLPSTRLCLLSPFTCFLVGPRGPTPVPRLGLPRPQRLFPHPVSEVRGRDLFKDSCCCSWGRGRDRGMGVKFFF